MQLFYNEDLNEDSRYFQFEKEESRHIVRVLRKSQGEHLSITNGKGWIFTAGITAADQKCVTAEVIKKTKQQKVSYDLHLAVAPTKNMDRFEWFLEKATEIGISQITPIICDRSERKVLKMNRLERIVLSAIKQSLKAYKPKLNPPVGFEEFVNGEHEEYKYIAHCEEGDKLSLFKSVSPNESILVLIGPEGDFSVKEIEIAIKDGFIPVTLGTSRLRTETAAIAACHTIALINE